MKPPTSSAFFAFSFCLTNFSFEALAAPTWTVGQIVKTTSGDVQGHAAPKAQAVSEYLGIPYAEPATGALRFAAPKKFVGNGTLSGDKFSPDCAIFPKPIPLPANASKPLATVVGALDQTGHEFGENCLCVNVWTKPQTGETSKAVLVWIHGGGFTIGSSNTDAYNGAFLADQEDVIVVTLNYRLDFFGFTTGPGFKDHNFGLLDQRSAVEWVRDNIAGFGGDPKRITIFGESAGGVSVDIYSYAWVDDPIVNGFIPESGATGLPLGSGLASNFTNWYNLTSKVGCGGSEAGEATVECMRNLPFKTILEAQTALGLSFLPVIDEEVVFSDYPARGAAGKFIKKPMLVGNNDNEVGLFKVLAELEGTPLPAVAEPVVNLGFTCPAGDAANYRTAAGVPAWRYRYYGDWPNLRISDNAGAFHSAEIPIVFGTSGQDPTQPDTDTQKAVKKIMMDVWTKFAKDPATGLTNLGLPKYNELGSTLLGFAFNNAPVVTIGISRQYDLLCGLLSDLL